MGFLSLFKNLFKKQSPEESNYLSLALTPNEILACIWSFDGDKVDVVGFGQKKFENVDSLIHQAAVAIDKAGEQAKSDVAKVVFCLSDYWLEAGKLKIETDKILKELSDDLELAPQAFIPIASAINHLLKVEEGITANAIIIGVFDAFCEVHLLQNNQVTASKTANAPINLEKVSQLIGQLKREGKDLPSRIIVYSQDQQIIEKLKQKNWEELFVQQPKITILDPRQVVEAVAYAQAADVLGYEPSLTSSPQDQKDSKPPKTVPVADEFGFVEGEDILASPNVLPKKETVAKEDHPVAPRESPENLAVLPQEEFLPKTKIDGLIPKIIALVKFRFSAKRLLAGFVILILLSAVATFLVSKTLTSAEVTIKVSAQNVEKPFRAEVVVENPADPESEIQGQDISVISTGSQKAVATGSKKLGDKARGTVRVLNWDKQPKTFSAGTEVISKDGLKFTLDNEVEVASRSAYLPGESKINATALDVGPKYNVGAGVDFTIVGFDEIFYSAVSDNSFTGGAERQSTVVSREDLERLEKSLTDSQVEKAKADLREKATGKKLHDEALLVKILRKDFDKKVDDEASLINLDLEVEVGAIVYEEEKLKEYLVKNAIGDIPSNLEARVQNIEILETQVLRQRDTLRISGKFRAGLIPKFNEDELKDKIASKSQKETRGIIKAQAEVQDVIIKFTPNLPIAESLPTNKSKIKFKVEAI